jgi:hypothetical protein
VTWQVTGARSLAPANVRLLSSPALLPRVHELHACTRSCGETRYLSCKFARCRSWVSSHSMTTTATLRSTEKTFHARFCTTGTRARAATREANVLNDPSAPPPYQTCARSKPRSFCTRASTCTSLSGCKSPLALYTGKSQTCIPMASIRSAQLPRSWKRSTCADIRGEQLLPWADCALPVTALQVSSICRSTPPCSTPSGSSRTPQGTHAARSTTCTDHIQCVVYESHVYTAAASRTALRVCGGQQSLGVSEESDRRGGEGGVQRRAARTRQRVHASEGGTSLSKRSGMAQIAGTAENTCRMRPARSLLTGRGREAGQKEQQARQRREFPQSRVSHGSLVSATKVLDNPASSRLAHFTALPSKQDTPRHARISTPLSLHMHIHHARLS